MEWTKVSFTKLDSTDTVYERVTAVDTVLADAVGLSEPSVTFRCTDSDGARADPLGTVGVLTAECDGAVYTLRNTTLVSRITASALGEAMVTFAAYSADGSTNPLSVRQTRRLK